MIKFLFIGVHCNLIKLSIKMNKSIAFMYLNLRIFLVIKCNDKIDIQNSENNVKVKIICRDRLDFNIVWVYVCMCDKL